jgi:hypothetical protein
MYKKIKRQRKKVETKKRKEKINRERRTYLLVDVTSLECAQKMEDAGQIAHAVERRVVKK